MNFPNFTGLPLFPNSDLTKDNNMINNNFPGLDAFRSQYFNFMQNSNFQGAPPFPNQNFQNVNPMQNSQFPFTQPFQFTANSEGDKKK